MKCINQGVFFQDGKVVEANQDSPIDRDKTIAYQILEAHTKSKEDNLLHITFDSLTSHDITYVGIIQTARASGLKEFPVPYVLTNCHNTLCAVGGTINEDDHQFALSAAHKYGGIYVPPNVAVIHSYNREMMTGCGKMILGSDSHTRYGALGTMGIGEGGGEIAKQLLCRTYDIAYPEVVLVYVTGEVKPGVGPHDVALALIKETYESGFVKNAVMEFVGPGIHGLSQDYRNGIDVMTTETTCLSSIWQTDTITEEYYKAHQRSQDYKQLKPKEGAYYDRCIFLDLSEIECMIALPMHPSRAVSIHEFQKNPQAYVGDMEVSIVEENAIRVQQGIIAGCSGGTYENIVAAERILRDNDCGNGVFRLSIYPDSMPIQKALVDQGVVGNLLLAGATFREAFCGPCFGAGDTPANGEFSIRHTTRNFPNREGSKPTEGQQAYVALMDARSIAATAVNQGILTAASDVVSEKEFIEPAPFDSTIYDKRVYNGFGKAEPEYPLHMGPNIKDWPEQPELLEDLLVKIVSHIDDDVTTTDELIPSGETSSYRSNPLRLAEFTLSRRDPDYVGEAKAVQQLTKQAPELISIQQAFAQQGIVMNLEETRIASAIYARNPGDGSAREQAASCQRVLGAGANFASKYATKRYRSNCINWGILPFVTQEGDKLPKGSWVLVKDILTSLHTGKDITAYVYDGETVDTIQLELKSLTEEETEILKKGCLINYYKVNA